MVSSGSPVVVLFGVVVGGGGGGVVGLVGLGGWWLARKDLTLLLSRHSAACHLVSTSTMHSPLPG